MRQKRFRLYLLCLFTNLWLFLGCKAPEDKEPDNLIDQNRMVAILSEVHIAEARVSRMGLRSIDSSNIVYKHLEAQIFKKLGVDTSAYRKSYIYYSSHPADMERIYKKVTENLTSRTKPKKAPNTKR